MLTIVHNFNSIKVRLELSFNLVAPFVIHYFNSIKVRLELNSLVVKDYPLKFQFHKGAIRTYTD